MYKFAFAAIAVVFGIVQGVKYLDHSLTHAEQTRTDNARADLSRARPSQTAVAASYGEVILRADSRGHFITKAQINHATINVMVDTGATSVAIPYKDARRAGINLPPSAFKYRVNTANGVAYVAQATLNQVRIGTITVYNVPAVVAQRGMLSETLLGMTFLNRLNSFKVSRGRLIMQR